MKSIVKTAELSFTAADEPRVTITLAMTRKDAQTAFQALQEVLSKGKLLQVEIVQQKKKRSLTANSYFWVLVDKVAKVIRSTPDEVYIQMLTRYGQREPELLSVVEAGAPMVYRATKNHCCEVGESWLNGKLFKHLAILKGSSEYDSAQMAILIDGTVYECQNLGIETKPPEEIESLKKSWKGDKP